MRLNTLFTAACHAFLLALPFPAALAADPLTVRVDAAHGAPRIVVNGKPVRPRMFFGIPGSAPIAAAAGPREVAFEFRARDTADTATMHFRFGSKPGTIDLDDIRVVDLADGREILPRRGFEDGPGSFAADWSAWPPDEKNTVGKIAVTPGAGKDGSAGLRIELTAPSKPGDAWPDFHLHHHANLHLKRDHRYRATFWVNAHQARDLMVAFYRPGETYVHLGGPEDPFAKQIKLAAGVGVDFVSFPFEVPWPRPGRPADWSAVDLACREVLDANPRALLLPRIGMMPPEWWLDEHPGERMQWEDGRRALVVVASPEYRRDAAERLRALVEHIEATFGEHVAGYHPCGQNTGEWFYEGTWNPALSGYAPADLAAWRRWLTGRYQTDARLRTAWNEGTASLKEVLVPSPALRHASPSGVFRDPSREQALIDWADFQQYAMSDCVRDLAHAVRVASKGRKLVLFFYGYLFEFGPVANGSAVSGHYALRRILDSPDVDILCSPISYFDRGLGQSAPAMTAAESVALAGKMWLYEDDTRTYLGTGDFPGAIDAVSTLEDTNRELLRNVGQEAVRNFATWWMDLGATGWFNDPGMWREMDRLRAIDQPLLDRPGPYRPEVAAVIDERMMIMTAPAGVEVTRPGLYEVRAALGRLGAPYGQYLLDDVLAGRVRAKLYVILNAWRLSEAGRQALVNQLRGAAVIWCYAPGYFDGARPSLGAMKDLTGFDLVTVPAHAKSVPTDAGRRLGLVTAFGPDRPIRPLFAATGLDHAGSLATYADGSASVARVDSPDGPRYFVGTPGLSTEILRLAARAAGVHLYTETDCNVYARAPFVVLHASQDGPITVRGPVRPVGSARGSSWTWTDALTSERLGDGPSLKLELKRGDTRILRHE
ncbi:beta-galactosidase [Aquisphaera insulae]|uniref:beta-galactosidase n=1 Tax=Aquisphaera insulae TaxID=2712864 RepID=UPI0013E9E29B|nr:beta-galactosidase [Aquisphaera insulae]